MKRVKTLVLVLATLSMLLLTFGFSWTHAVAVLLVTKKNCPETLVARAELDVARLFGRASASPLWLCADKPVFGLDVSHGKTLSTLFLPSIIIIGIKGPNRNVMAHEYAHAELAARSKSRYFLIPTWFDEGLAMQVDHRRAYSRKALKRYLKRAGTRKPRLDELAKSSRFYKREVAGMNYAFARCVVKNWLKSQDGGQPLKLVNNLGWLNRFPIDQFRLSEKICLTR